MQIPSAAAAAFLAGTLVLATTSFGAAVAQSTTSPNICFVVYQMADNNLESFIRDDNLEIIESCAVSKPNLFTWIYFDGLDATGGWDDIDDPLEKVWVEDGSSLLQGEKYDGSQYLTYRHDLEKMVSETQLPGEQNGDDPDTVYEFLKHAFEDCVAKGADEYMVSLSSHGAGFYGFGGDDNPYRARLLQRRKKTDGGSSSGAGRELVQQNVDLAGAIVKALQAVDGTPDVLDVLGFDACLMMSVSALYEYQGVAKYYLASEATEPGHGWAYKELCDTESALAVATSINDNFLSQEQGFWGHQAPKTLALVETSKFDAFRTSFEAFARELKSAIEAGDDPEFFALLQRSRTGAVAFESVLDDPGTGQKTSLDVGSFLNAFDDLCSPRDRASLDAVKNAYDALYVRRGNGPGTPEGTGMHVMWPTKRSYTADPGFFDGFLFDNPAVTRTAPDFFDMVHFFVRASSPRSRSNAGGNCLKSAQSDITPTREGQLLLNPTLSSQGGTVTVKSDLVTSADEVYVLYGINGTEWLFLDSERQRQMRELKQPEVEPNGGASPPRTAKKFPSTASPLANRIAPSSSRRSDHQARRRDVEEGFLFVFAGSVEGTYSGPAFSASGARAFYFLKDSDNLTPIFLETSPSELAGVKSAEIPVMYFPPSVDVQSSDLSYELTLEEGVAMGGLYGSLKFGLNEAKGELTTGFSLMTNDDPTPNSTISETPPSAGGRIVPIIYVRGEADGVTYSDILGGVDQTVIEWNEKQDFSLLSLSPEDAILSFGLNRTTAVIDMFAFDYDDITDFDNLEMGKGYDYYSFAVEIDASVAAGKRSGAWLLSLAAFVGTFFLF